MRLILGIEDGHYVAARHSQRQIQPMWFVDRLIVEDDELYIRIAQFANFGLRLRDCTGIIFAADRHDLYQSFRIVKIIDLLNRLAIHLLFMSSWQKNGKGET